MPTPIPPVLAPYLSSSLHHNSTTVITTVLNTSANWLLLRFIKAAISGVEDDFGNNSYISSKGDATGSSAPCVIFISFLKSYEFWVELSRKIALDLAALTARKQFAYIDGLTVGLNLAQSTNKVTKPKSLSINDIKNAITAAKSSLAPNTTPATKSTLIIDGLDLLLGIQPDIDAARLQILITELQDAFSNVALTLSADSPLLHNKEASATPLELEHSIFVRTIAHQSSWLMQLRPLETGHAKDVSGVLRITRGGADVTDGEDLPDGEWLYQVKGDGSVRVWSRGE